MAGAPAITLARGFDGSWNRGTLISVVVHLCILIGIPLILSIAQKKSSFQRPPTFQLVTAPPSLRPFTPASLKTKQSREAQKQKQKSERAVPAKSQESAENIKELSSLLEELPAPAHIAAVGNFKHNWYLAQVQERVERNWNPAAENRNDSVVVAFTIMSDGSISEPVVHQSAADQALNALALRAVKLAAPFSKLPPGVSENQYEMLCTLKPARK